jgi:hypothetical protein
MADLPVPLPAVAELYDYRGKPGVDAEAPPLWLPYHQGDVFSEVDIPGIDNPERLAMLFLHPCTMRRGATLISDVTVIAVTMHTRRRVVDEPDHWARWFSVMPLPDLTGTGRQTHVADFLKIATIAAIALPRSQRVGSLSQLGRGVMQQRIIHHLTRLVPTLDELDQATRAVELEIEAQADWVQAACLHHQAETDEVITAAESAFDAFLSENEGSRRKGLSSQRSAQVVMEIGREKESRYPGAPVAAPASVVGEADQADGPPRADSGHEPGATAVKPPTGPWWLRAARRLFGRQPPRPPSGQGSGGL